MRQFFKICLEFMVCTMYTSTYKHGLNFACNSPPIFRIGHGVVVVQGRGGGKP